MPQKRIKADSDASSDQSSSSTKVQSEKNMKPKTFFDDKPKKKAGPPVAFDLYDQGFPKKETPKPYKSTKVFANEQKSNCGFYILYNNKDGKQYLKPLSVNTYIEKMKKTVFQTPADFFRMIDELNTLAGDCPCNYHHSCTEKYIKISCRSCKLFDVWFGCTNYNRSTFGKNLKEKLNIKLERKINLNHNAKDHDLSKLQFPKE